MNKLEYAEYLKTAHWDVTRAWKLFYQPTCELCGTKRNLQVHHKTYKNIHKEEMEDLQVLCHSCHEGEHGTPAQKASSRFIAKLAKAKRFK